MTNNPDKGMEYAREAFALSHESDYRKGAADSLLNEGWFFYFQNGLF